MPTIQSKRALRRAKPVKAGTQHYSNGTEWDGDKDEAELTLRNNQEVQEKLTDPEDYDARGSLHGGQEIKKAPVNAGVKSKPVKKVKAAVGDQPDPETTNVGTLPDDTDPAEGYLPNEGAPNDGDLKLQNNQEPEGGGSTPSEPLEVRSDLEDPDDGDDDETIDETDIEAIDPEDSDDAGDAGEDIGLPMADDGGLDDEEGDDEELDWDAPAIDGEEDEDTDGDDIVAPDLVEEDEQEEKVLSAADDPDQLPLADIQNLDDKFENCAFVEHGNTLLVLKANTVIASMGRLSALKANVADVYMEPQFQQVMASEFAKKGLRAGLKANGFVMARVNVASSKVVNARVKQQTQQVRASLERSAQTRTQALEQALAIASVGINRSFFKNVNNELRSALQSELTAAGVRGADKILQRAFAAHGPAYIAATFGLATKIQAMPEEARNSYAEALDLVDDEGQFEEQGCDTLEATADDSFDDDGFDQEEPMPSSLTASLLQPARKQRQIFASQGADSNVAIQAAAILSGNKPLF